MRLLTKPEGLTDLQTRFVYEYVRCGDVQLASALAGYTDSAGGYAALQTPHVLAAVKAETNAFIYRQAFPGALRFLDACVQNEGLENRLRIEAARAIAKIAFDFEKLHSSHAENAGQKPLDQLTPAELKDHLNRLQQELANRAKPVLDAPVSAPPNK